MKDTHIYINIERDGSQPSSAFCSDASTIEGRKLEKGSSALDKRNHTFLAPSLHDKLMIQEGSNANNVGEDIYNSNPQHAQTGHLVSDVSMPAANLVVYGSNEDECYSSSPPPPIPSRLYLDDEEILRDLHLLPVLNLDHDEDECYSSSPPPPIPPRLYLDDEEVFTNQLPVMSLDSVSSTPPAIPARLYNEESLDLHASITPPLLPAGNYLDDGDIVTGQLPIMHLRSSSATPPAIPIHLYNEESLDKIVSSPQPPIPARNYLDGKGSVTGQMPVMYLESDSPRPPAIPACLNNEKSLDKYMHASYRPHPDSAQNYLDDEDVLADKNRVKNLVASPASSLLPSLPHSYCKDDSPPPIPARTSLSEQLLSPSSMDQLSNPEAPTASDSCSETNRPDSRCYVIPEDGIGHFVLSEKGMVLSSETLPEQHKNYYAKKCFRTLSPSPPPTSDQQHSDMSQEEISQLAVVFHPYDVITEEKGSNKHQYHCLEDFTSTQHAAALVESEQLGKARRKPNAYNLTSCLLVDPSPPQTFHAYETVPVCGIAPLPSVHTSEYTEADPFLCATQAGYKSYTEFSHYSLPDNPPPLPKRATRRIFDFTEKKHILFQQDVQVQPDFSLQRSFSKPLKLWSKKKPTIHLGDRVATRIFKQDPQADDTYTQYDKLCHGASTEHQNVMFPGGVEEPGYDHLTMSDEPLLIQTRDILRRGDTVSVNNCGDSRLQQDDVSASVTHTLVSNVLTGNIHGREHEACSSFDGSSSFTCGGSGMGSATEVNFSNTTPPEYPSAAEHSQHMDVPARCICVIQPPNQENNELVQSSCSPKSHTWSTIGKERMSPWQQAIISEIMAKECLRGEVTSPEDDPSSSIKNVHGLARR